VPSLVKEGWTRHQKNAAKPPLMERTGWFVQLPIIGGFNEPPRLRPLRRLRAIFLVGASTPPLPRRGLRSTRPFGGICLDQQLGFLNVETSQISLSSAQIA